MGWDRNKPDPWVGVFVVAWSSLLVGCALAQLNALTGDHSAVGALRLTTTEVSACTAALYGAAGVCACVSISVLRRLVRFPHVARRVLVRAHAQAWYTQPIIYSIV